MYIELQAFTDLRSESRLMAKVKLWPSLLLGNYLHWMGRLRKNQSHFAWQSFLHVQIVVLH